MTRSEITGIGPALDDNAPGIGAERFHCNAGSTRRIRRQNREEHASSAWKYLRPDVTGFAFARVQPSDTLGGSAVRGDFPQPSVHVAEKDHPIRTPARTSQRGTGRT